MSINADMSTVEQNIQSNESTINPRIRLNSHLSTINPLSEYVKSLSINYLGLSKPNEEENQEIIKELGKNNFFIDQMI